MMEEVVIFAHVFVGLGHSGTWQYPVRCYAVLQKFSFCFSLLKDKSLSGMASRELKKTRVLTVTLLELSA